MKRVSSLFLFALALSCSLMFTSCVRWNLGARVREASETRMGADIAHPVDGKLYDGRYLFAPVVEYKPRTPIVSAGWYPSPAVATQQRRTGRTVVAEIEFPKGEPVRFVRALHAMPKGVVGHPYTFNMRATERSFGTMVCDRSRQGRAARAAEAPLTYVVDPVLSLVSTPIYWVYLTGRMLVTGGRTGWEKLNHPTPAVRVPAPQR